MPRASQRRASTSLGPGGRFAEFVGARPRLVAISLLLVTAGLSVPMIAAVPEETASQSPVTEITATEELIAERFADDVFDYPILIEAVGGDVLDRDPLLTLLNRGVALRTDPQLGKSLMTVRDQQLGIDVYGMWTIADSVDLLLQRLGIGGLVDASEEQIDGAVAAMLNEGGPGAWGLATQSFKDAAGVWHSPALFTIVFADNERLGGGGFVATIGTNNLEKEYFARDIVALLQGDGSEFEVWSPASDVNLTSNEQGELAGPYIGLTIAVVLIIVGVAFRSYWAVAVAGAALGMLMVWLRGGSNLVGFKSDQILSIVLPISMISFGVDSAFHGIGRVREEQRRGNDGRRAFVLGMGAVLGALVLAATSDAAAFLSNTGAGIESVIQFGFAAAMATVAAFVLLGVATPLFVAVAESKTGNKTLTRFGLFGDLIGSIIAAGLATAAVLVLVFISATIGLALLAVYIVVALLLPYAVAKRSSGVQLGDAGRAMGAARLGGAVAGVASRPWATIGVAFGVTAAALWGALQLEVTFDVNDFFSPDSDFVVGLDKTAEYLGDRGGESVTVYVETDLTSPETLDHLNLFVAAVAKVEDSPLAVGDDGQVRVAGGVLDLVADAADLTNTGTPESLSDLYAQGLEVGLRDNTGNLVWTANEVGSVLWRSDNLEDFATVLTYQIPDTRNQENVTRTREVLEPLASDLEGTLLLMDPDSNVVVTGSAIYRDDQLAAIRRAMLLALPIAVVACLAISALFMRSIRYALVSVVPILLVVIWLYGLMYQAGYSINVVTSIIGAVSVGIGIDFSTHFTMRFLEETRGGLAKGAAIAQVGEGTGTALFGSAVTSVAGFGVLAFAPMPMFASYGLLTAVMIALALVASLFVLPSLLSVVTRETRASRAVALPVESRRDDGPLRLVIGRDVPAAVIEQLRQAVAAETLEGVALDVAVVPGSTVRSAVEKGEYEIGIATLWRGSSASDQLPDRTAALAREEVVSAGSSPTPGTDRIALVALERGLLIGAPHPESVDLIRGLLSAETGHKGLIQAASDVRAGMRLAAMTGGAMLLPETMVAEFGGLPVRRLDPPVWLDTVLVVGAHCVNDPVVREMAIAISEAVDRGALPKLAPV